MKDLLGAFVSALCILHCLALPALISVGLPLAGAAIVTGEKAHLALSLMMILLALWAFPVGWFRHRQVLPGCVAMLGAALLALTILAGEHLEAYFASAAGVSLIVAHVINRYLLVSVKANRAQQWL